MPPAPAAPGFICDICWAICDAAVRGVRGGGVGGCGGSGERKGGLPLSFPRMKIKTGCSPKRLRKYHEREDTHRTSRSRVAMPDCSMDLKRMVRGKGSFTITEHEH